MTATNDLIIGAWQDAWRLDHMEVSRAGGGE